MNVALALLTLNLSLLGAGASCASGAHDTTAAAATHVMTDGSMPMSVDGMHNHARASSDNGSPAHVAQTQPSSLDGVQLLDRPHHNAPPCEPSTPSNCCRALASCSVVFSVPDAESAAHFNTLSLVIAGGASHTPLSEIVAPEPPPPKVLPA